jgi:aryl-phospho-beta-D-glucosidase BglC (GH1 family)
MKKRILSLFLAFSIAIGVVPTLAVGANAPVAISAGAIRAVGDVNNDGTVDIFDALEILKMLAGMQSVVVRGTPAWKSAQIATGSLTADTPDIFDALEILKMLAGMQHEIPAAGFGMTSFDFVARMGAGWNLGNTFDAHAEGRPAGYAVDALMNPVEELEVQWLGSGQAREARRTSRALIQSVKAQGFDTIRIPVTWYKVADPQNNWRIRADWMARVREVVQWAIDADMYVILNTHHEESVMSLYEQDREQAALVVRRMWEQIAHEFRDFDHRLVFEGLNEPRTKGVSWEWQGNAVAWESLNILNQVFVNAVRSTGGKNNRWRVLMVPTYAATAVAQGALDAFTVPDDLVPDRIAMSVHSYLPNAFAIRITQSGFDANGADAQRITTALTNVAARATALGIPVVHGEYGSAYNENNDARVAHAAYYVAEARKHGMGMVWWDSGRSDVRPLAADQNFGIIDRAAPHAALHAEIVAAITS